MPVTQYEIVAIKGDKRARVAFTACKTRESLRNNMVAEATRVVEAIGADPDATIVRYSADRIVLSDGAVVTWSGRTLRDCEREG